MLCLRYSRLVINRIGSIASGSLRPRLCVPKLPADRAQRIQQVHRLCFQRSSCRYPCSLVAGTNFESSKLALPIWFEAMHLISQDKNSISSLEPKRHLGVSQPAAWLMKHKIMEVMLQREEARQLARRVEIDDGTPAF